MKCIAQLVGLPPRHFQRLYLDLVHNLADYFLTSDMSGNHSGGLDYTLHVAERALNIRQRYLLPENTAPEEIARRGDRWTYGVFLAATFHDLRSRQAASPGTSSEELEAVARSLVPDIGLDWLASEPDLMTSWTAVVVGDTARAGVLGTIVGQAVRSPADADSHDEPLDCDPPVKEEETEKEEPATALDLASGIKSLVASGRLQINVGDHAWVTETDLWLNLRAGLDVVRQWVAETTSDFPLKNNELLDLLQQNKICAPLPEKQQAVWPMCIKIGVELEKKSLIRIPIDVIWPDPGDRPPPFDGEIISRNRADALTNGQQARLPFPN